MEGVGSLVLIVIRYNNATGGKSLLSLRVSKLTESQRSRNTHDARWDQGLRVEAHTNVGNQNTTGDSSESRAHDLVHFGHGKVGNEGLDQHGGFTLTDKRRRGSDNGLGTWHSHGPEEEDSEFTDEPLKDTPVVQELDERDEEDNGGDNTEHEVGVGRNIGGCQEGNTILGETQKQTCELGDEVEDVVSSLGTEDEQCNDKLHQHTDDDGVPNNHAAVARSRPEAEDED